jgi:tRNA G10  N-methylase Trm11
MPLEESENESGQFLIVFGFSKASELELLTLEESRLYDFRIILHDGSAALIETTEREAMRIIQRLGGAYKVGRVLGNELSLAVDQIDLPESEKFHWSVSSYNVSEDLLRISKEALASKLKKEGLGKGKFVFPSLLSTSAEGGTSEEPPIEEVARRILPRNGGHGVDLIVSAGIRNSQPIFAQTVGLSDVEGFHERDFGRPFQDPRMTISPRIARMMVNLSLPKRDDGPARLNEAHLTLLDPFCGLGTIAVEALACHFSVVVSDRDEAAVTRCRRNIDWFLGGKQLRKGQSVRAMQVEASRLRLHLKERSIDSVATEPILLPVFQNNPSETVALRLLRESEGKYEMVLKSLLPLLRDRGSKIVFTSPVVVDSSGDFHGMKTNLSPLHPYHPEGVRNLSYPLEIPSAKKRFVRRQLNVYVFE